MKEKFVGLLWAIIWCCSPFVGIAQTDSLLLTYEQFLQQVYTQHPIAKQINLMREKAEQTLQGARGGFDPSLNTNWDYKHFGDKAYYNILNAHIKAPTWIGLEVETGFNYANGYYLNPENKLPSAGQAYIGLKMPLLKGLWTDDRRVAIQQAKILQESSIAEIQLALNDLLYQAAQAYWEWTKAFNNLIVIKQSLVLAQEQLEIARQSFFLGDQPAIDTLKIFIQVQERNVLLMETQLEVENAGRMVSSFLWDASQQPLEISANAFPVSLQNLKISPLDQSLLDNQLQQLQQHPSLQLYDFKIRSLEIDKRLKFNKLFPSLYVKYNFLSANHVSFFDNVGGEAFIENYKFGISFSMPLFLRKERSDLEWAKIKLREANYGLQSKQQELKVKIQNYFYNIQTYAQQVVQIEQMVTNYTALLDAERLKLGIGESSVFLVNTRENQLLDAQLKLVKQQVAHLKARASYFWVTANLSSNLN